MNRRVIILLLLMVAAVGLVWLDRNGWSLNNAGADAPAPVRATRPVSRSQQDNLAGLGKESAPLANDTINPLASLSLLSLSETVMRPLFTPSRRPLEPEPDPEPQVAEPPPPPADGSEFALLGVVSSAGKSMALLNWNESKIVRLRKNESFAGWTVFTIKDREVVIRNEDREVTLRLFEKRDDKPAGTIIDEQQ